MSLRTVLNIYKGECQWQSFFLKEVTVFICIEINLKQYTGTLVVT